MVQDNPDDIKKVTVVGGIDKGGVTERVKKLEVQAGEILAIIGPTGSGKSQLLSDMEQLAYGDTCSKRQVLINDKPPAVDLYGGLLVAQLSQRMNFVMDASVERFLRLHAESRGRDKDIVKEALNMTNTLCGEPISLTDNLQVLSGGQSRALMIADIVLISDAPVVLIDEIENAGINKIQALKLLGRSRKITVVATHDPVLILMAERRLVMKNGGMHWLWKRTAEESFILEDLKKIDTTLFRITEELRSGKVLNREVLYE